MITDRFTKLTQAVSLRQIEAFTVARDFSEEWGLKYGAPQTVLSDNRSHFALLFFRRFCLVMVITFATTYRPRTNDQTERFNKTILWMLRCYVRDNPRDWNDNVQVFAFAYKNAIHSRTNENPFELVFS